LYSDIQVAVVSIRVQDNGDQLEIPSFSADGCSEVTQNEAPRHRR